jgi:hypothetical protein
MTFPNSNCFIGFDSKKDFPEVFIGTIGCQQQNAFFLVNSRQVKEIGLLPKRKILVAVSGHLVVGMENGNSIFWEQFDKPVSVVFEKGWVDG